MLRPYLDRLGCVLALATAACGSGDPVLGTDGGSDGPQDGDKPDNPCNPPPPEMREIEYTVCPPAMDASAEAGDDAGDAGEPDAGAPCITGSCVVACPYVNNRGATMCTEHGSDGGTHYATCAYYYLCGRRPAGMRSRSRSRSRSTGMGRYLAGAAWMEAASIHAFRRLARELEAHGAPAWLVEEARNAARDEARHARSMARLARHEGARVSRVRALSSRRVRSLRAIAMENAVEGCVRETYGALLARWQADHAVDAAIRETMQTIAPDELRHAALAAAVADWIEPKLSARARARVERARADAIRKLEGELRADLDGDIRIPIGLPTMGDALTLQNALFFG